MILIRLYKASKRRESSFKQFFLWGLCICIGISCLHSGGLRIYLVQDIFLANCFSLDSCCHKLRFIKAPCVWFLNLKYLPLARTFQSDRTSVSVLKGRECCGVLLSLPSVNRSRGCLAPFQRCWATPPGLSPEIASQRTDTRILKTTLIKEILLLSSFHWADVQRVLGKK